MIAQRDLRLEEDVECGGRFQRPAIELTQDAIERSERSELLEIDELGA